MSGRVISAILTLKDRNFSSGIKQAGNATGDLQRRLKRTSNRIKSFRDDTVSQMSSMAKGVVGGIAAAFAIDKVKDFGVSLIQSAANAQAVGAQFEQVFGNMGGSAQATIDNLGNEFGMVSSRLKPAFTTMTSMFKGLGMDTEDAMKQAESAVTIAADAAAFYDKSYEDANAALNSFIKGNYEGGEAIGLFANETQLSSWAAKNLGVDWKNLDEAGKQVARLKFAESMQAAAGATGQAARESDSYENQLGNLKETWDSLKAKLGAPILEPAIKGLKTLASWVGSVNTDAIISGFSSFGGYMKDTFGPVVKDVKNTASGLWDSFKDNGGIEAVKSALDGFKSGLEWVIDNREPLVAAVSGIAAGMATLKIVNGVAAGFQLMKAALLASTASTVMQTIATQGLNAAIRANPLGWIVTLIGLVVTAGILLYQNWDTVKAKAGQLWDKTREVFGNIYDWGASKIQGVTSFFSGLTDKVSSFISKITSFKMPEWVSTIGDKISSAASKVSNWVNPEDSFAVGTNRVPHDMVANIHKDEMIIPARQSERLRRQGVNIDNIDQAVGRQTQSASPVVSTSNTTNNQGGPTVIIQNLNAKGVTASEVVNEFVPQLKLIIANM